VGHTTSLSQRRWVGLQLARPVERISCRSKNAFRRSLAAFRSWRVSSRAPTQVADRFIVEGRARDRGEVPGAHEPGELPGVAPVGFDPVTRLFGNSGGRDHPADRVFFRQIPLEPIPTRAGFIDKDQVFGLRLELPHQGVDVTLSGAKGPQGDDLGVMIFGNVGHSDRLFVHIHSDVQRARLVQG